MGAVEDGALGKPKGWNERVKFSNDWEGRDRQTDACTDAQAHTR